MSILSKVSEAFWSPTIWLPPNTTWADIAPGSSTDIEYADYRDLVWPIPIAFIILAIRYVLET